MIAIRSRMQKPMDSTSTYASHYGHTLLRWTEGVYALLLLPLVLGLLLEMPSGQWLRLLDLTAKLAAAVYVIVDLRRRPLAALLCAIALALVAIIPLGLGSGRLLEWFGRSGPMGAAAIFGMVVLGIQLIALVAAAALLRTLIQCRRAADAKGSGYDGQRTAG